MRVLGNYWKDRDNNISFIRLLAAIMVLLGHSFFLINPSSWINSSGIRSVTAFGIDYGSLAVNVFFILSGFLVVASYLRKSSILLYLESRFLRIFPGLVVCNLFTVFIIGSFFTQLPLDKYLTNNQIWDYLWINSTLIFDGTTIRVFLPGVFTNNPEAGVNGPLWTLVYEVWMYISLAVIGVTGILKNRRGLYILFEILVILLFFPFIFFESNATRLGFYFFAGVFVYLIRERFPLSGWLALASLLAIFSTVGTVLYTLIMPIALVYCTFWFAFVPGGKIRLYSRLGDYSYGTYIYGLPVQQSIIALGPGIQPPALFGLSLLATLLIASISWYLVEYPCLGRKGSVTQLSERVRLLWQYATSYLQSLR